MGRAGLTWTLPEVALVAFGVMALLWQPMFYLNDEMPQALGHHTLAGGDLATETVPPGYGAIHGSIRGHPSLDAVADGPTVMPGSWMENVVALPAHALLWVVGAPLGLGFAVALVAGAAVGGALWTVLRRRLAPRPAALWSLGVGAVILAGAPSMARDPFLDVASLQLATMAWTAVAAALWWDLLRRSWGEGLAWAGTGLLLVGTPILFWSLDVKYHGLSLALEVMALWAYRDGARTPPPRTALAAALAGLALWNHLPSGLLLGAGLAVLALGGLREGRAFLPRLGAGFGGLAVGVVPLALERWARARVGATAARYVETDHGLAQEVARQSASGLVQGAFWNDPLAALDGMWQTYVWTDWMDAGAALSFLSWAPWLVLAAWTLADPARRRAVGPLLPLCVGYPLALGLLVGRGVLNPGGLHDVRHALTVWPFLFLLAWPSVAAVLRSRPASWWRGQVVAAGAVLAATLLTVNLLWHKSTGMDLVQRGVVFEATWLHRYAGVVLAAALAAGPVAVRAVDAVRARRTGGGAGPRPADAPSTSRPEALWTRAVPPLVAWSVAAGVSISFLLRAGLYGLPPPRMTAAHAVWFVDLLERALRWMAYSY